MKQYRLPYFEKQRTITFDRNKAANKAFVLVYLASTSFLSFIFTNWHFRADENYDTFSKVKQMLWSIKYINNITPFYINFTIFLIVKSANLLRILEKIHSFLIRVTEYLSLNIEHIWLKNWNHIILQEIPSGK